MVKKNRGKPRLWEWVLLSVALCAAGVLLGQAIRHYYRAAYPISYQDIVKKESGRNSLPESLVYAVIRTESGFDPDAQSNMEARGLMQITQPTFEWAQFRLKEQQKLHFDDLYESELNIHYGSAILRLLLDEFGTEANALCAYHAGWGTAKKWLADSRYTPDGRNIEVIPYGDTSYYVRKVLDTKEIYETLYDM